MEPKKLNKYKKCGPEQELQKKIVEYLKVRDWLVCVTHGNEFQMGLPDLWIAHYTFGVRWVEVKNPDAYSFTPAQLQTFPAMNSKAVGVWVMMYCDDYEYDKLFQPQNWHSYLGKSTHKRMG